MTIMVSPKNSYLFITFFNAKINTDNEKDEGIFTLYVGENEDEYIYTTKNFMYKII